MRTDPDFIEKDQQKPEPADVFDAHRKDPAPGRADGCVHTYDLVDPRSPDLEKAGDFA